MYCMMVVVMMTPMMLLMLVRMVCEKNLYVPRMHASPKMTLAMRMMGTGEDEMNA